MEDEKLDKLEEEFEKEFGVDKVIPEFMAKLKPVISEQLAVAKASTKGKRRKSEEQTKRKKLQKLKGEKILEGAKASHGIAVGIVRNVHEHDLELMTKIAPGEVVVGCSFRKGHYKYFKIAGAFVTDFGGRDSDTGFLARLFGKPAVGQTLEATLVLKDGQKVVVDGTEGVVYAYKE